MILNRTTQQMLTILHPQPGKDLINAVQARYISLAAFVLTLIFSLGGVITNVVNIAVFVKLGFSETSNISLMTMALCDLLSTILTLWGSLCVTPGFSDAELPFLPTEVAQLTGAGLSTFVFRCTAWVTAFISFERCLCILAPLKVKTWISPKSTTAVMVTISLVTIGPSIVLYWRWNFAWKFLPSRNVTVLGVVAVDTPGMILMETIINIVIGAVLPVSAFLAVLVCTFFLVVYLRRSSQWRKSTARSGANISTGNNSSFTAPKETISSKEERVVRLVVSIATIFIVCYTPSTLMILHMAIFPSFSLFGQHRNTLLTVYMISVLANSVSATANIFIYYNMGSKYRNTLQIMMNLQNSVKQ